MSEHDPPEPTPDPTPGRTPEPTLEPPAEPTLASAPEARPVPPSSARSLAYGCLSIVLALPFGVVYVLLTAAFGLGGGAACAAAVVIGMFLLRQGNKKPIVGAFAVGAAIAFALYGTCLIIIAKSS